MTIEALAPHERTLPAMLRRGAERHGERPLLAFGARAWTHRDGPRLAAARAASLRAAGIRRGDRVAAMLSNRIELIELVLACGWIGAAVVPINTAAMGPQIGYVVGDCAARLLVIEGAFVERLATAGLEGAALATIWVAGEAMPSRTTCEPMPARIACEPFPANIACEPLPALPDRSDDGEASAADPAIAPADTLAILYTSGTTGPAKGVLCSHAQLHWWGVHSADVLGVDADDVLCTTLPLFHINALNTFAQASLAGCRVAYEPRFSASAFWATMREREATVVYLLGAMVPILLAQPVAGAERGHRVRIGLGPGVPASAAAAFRERTGVPLLEGYGSTETNFVIASAPARSRPGSMGWLRPGFAARVVDANDVDLPAGEAGELVLRADEPLAFSSGYFGQPEATAAAWRDGWFHTGDRVVREADGCFRFVDRLKDAIRRRGENISSYEVEQVLQSHPGVASVAVFPVRSELAEDEVMAALVARPGESLDPAEVARFCARRLPSFAIPRFIDIVDELPRTENGKVQKYKLRERGATASAWDRQAAARGAKG
ncbi:MAG TPA: ATP-dependent acyl-CoA ligase [Caldimonas sp.]|nr:ATP-dependent acyl-CoA ligase [Caldimonas sp.]